MLSFIFWLWNLTDRFLDWFNGTKVDTALGIMTITYRYRWKKYRYVVPYDLSQGPLIGVRKDQLVDLEFQPRLKIYVEPSKLGLDRIEPVMMDD